MKRFGLVTRHHETIPLANMVLHRQTPGKKRRRSFEVDQQNSKITKTQCQTRVQTETVAQKDATDFGTHETQEMPVEARSFYCET